MDALGKCEENARRSYPKTHPRDFSAGAVAHLIFQPSSFCRNLPPNSAYVPKCEYNYTKTNKRKKKPNSNITHLSELE